MHLSDTLAPQVSASSRTRGEAYFLHGAVRSLHEEDGIVEATVRGTQLYTVWLEPDNGALTASCTCPHFTDHLQICKHVWAVILAAEAQRLPLVADGAPAPRTRLQARGHRETMIDAAPPPPDAAAPPRPNVRPAEPWRELLGGAGPAGPAQPDTLAPAPRQLLYVIDAPASLHGDGAGVVMDLMTRDAKRNGEWARPKPAYIRAAEIRTQPDPVDRRLLERLAGPRPYYDWDPMDRDGHQGLLSRVRLRGELLPEIVRRVCDTSRAMLRPSAGDGTAAAELLPLAWDDGEPWRFTVAIRDDQPGTYIVEGWFARGDERMELADAVLAPGDGLLITHTHAARLDDGGAQAWLTVLRREGVIAVPQDAHEELVDTLLTISPQLAAVPEALRTEVVQGRPAPHLRLRTIKDRPDQLRAELTFDYDGVSVAPEAPEPVLRQPGSRHAIRRDTAAEQRAMETLRQVGCRRDPHVFLREPALLLPAQQLPPAVHRLLADGWDVEAEGHVYRRSQSARLDVRSGIDWFELHGDVAYDDQRATLPALLAALQRGEAFIRLDDGSLGLLPDAWLQRYAPLARLGSATGDHVRFQASQAFLLDAALTADPEASWDAASARARVALQGFDGIRPADPPASFTGALRAYQREGLGWLLFLQQAGVGGCLADDMGLGKTVMVLALLATRREAPADGPHRPSLIVAPRSLVFNWRQEAARFVPGLRVLEYLGSNRAAARAAFDQYDLVLTTYGTLRQDASLLTETPFDYVVLDESQAIKNASTAAAKATRVLSGRHRLALSGTPIENHVGELWSLFEFLNPGMLGTAAAFRASASAAGDGGDDDTMTVLARALRPLMLRRTKEQVASDLPQKTEQTLYCELERPQRLLYDELRAHYRRTLLDEVHDGDFGRKKIQVLEALLRLRQAACHPGLIDKRRLGDTSAKLDVLLSRLTEIVEQGHKTLVFSQFTSLLAIVRTALDKQGVRYEYLDGRTRDRQERVERFQSDPDARLFLISLKAGGLGLNLTAADYVFLLDPWWNPAVEAQAIDRAHRIGQLRHVFAYRLIARDTVEERVLELQQRKRQLADAILSESNSVIADLKREDLDLLLS